MLGHDLERVKHRLNSILKQRRERGKSNLPSWEK